MKGKPYQNRKKQAKHNKPPVVPPANPPAIEGDKNVVGHSCKPCSDSVCEHRGKPTHWTAYAEAICALALVVITGTYTYYAKQQAGAAIAATTNATETLNTVKKQFDTDQRPYVIVAKIEFHSLPNDPTVYADVKPLNYGKSPAIHVLTTGEVFEGQNTMAAVDSFFSGLPEKPSEENWNNVIPPGIVDLDKNGVRTTLRTHHSVGQDALKADAKIDFGIVAASRTWYQDISGNQYWTDFCSGPIASGAMGFCAKHNEIR